MHLSIESGVSKCVVQLPPEAHGAVSAMLAALNFNDAGEVNAAQLRLQTQAPALFPDACFDGVAPEDVGRALASLILSHGAAQRNRSTRWIAPGAHDALGTLCGRLTPSGQDALLQSLESGHGENAFSRYLGELDRWCLAGHLYRQRASTRGAAGDLGPAPQDADAQAAAEYLQAVDCYTRAGQSGLAAPVCLLAADLSMQTHQTNKAVDLYLTAADAYLRTGRPGRAAAVYLRVFNLYTDLGQPELAAATCLKAAHAARAAADAHPQKGKYALAGDVYLLVAKCYADAGRPDLAADAWLWAAQAYTRAHEPRKALAAYRQAAEANTEARRPGLAGDAWRGVAALHKELGEPELSADANENVATAYRWAALGGPDVVQPLPAAHYFLLAAYAHEAVAKHARGENAKEVEKEHRQLAEDAYKRAAHAFMKEGLVAAATNPYMLASSYKQAVVACTRAIHESLAANDLSLIADLYMQLGYALRGAGEPEDKQNQAFLIAAGYYQEGWAYLPAAVAHMERGDSLTAAPLFERAKEPASAGHAYFGRNMYERAEANFRRAYRFEPDAEQRRKLRLLAENMSKHAVLSDRNV
ncbi:hypothetical protein [Pandoraea oxalativorans]|uniref:Gamma-soluble NSF attachment protein n=1 Tax=Pandoraea oxalativorans TaxID=573737 RepID=A0A0G3IDP6_9BURK|nr:hypothetical protein [Pandoraea oxalativorans]AKK24748.1 hypothetical protein MB84_28505 [Pandoraea oxalativorans]